MKEKGTLILNPFGTDVFIKDTDIRQPDPETLNLPLYSAWGAPTVFVNAKQCHAIIRRRIKKMQKYNTLMRSKVKPKVKYEKRSEHAKRRQRTQNGKFLTKNESQQADSTNADDQPLSDKKHLHKETPE